MELARDQMVGVGEPVALSHRRIVATFVWAIGAVNLAYVFALVSNVPLARAWLLLGLERNPSTWLSSALLGVTAGAAWLVGRGRSDQRRWSLVAFLLLAMSLDEVAKFHEKVVLPSFLPRIGQRGWILAGVVLVVAVAVVLVPWALQLERRVRAALFAGAFLFALGAVGFETFGGEWQERHGKDAMYWWIEGVEENLEMFGVLVVLHGLLGHFRRSSPIRLSVV